MTFRTNYTPYWREIMDFTDLFTGPVRYITIPGKCTPGKTILNLHPHGLPRKKKKAFKKRFGL